MRARTSSGSAASEAAVKPTRSQKSTVTTLRSSCTDAAGRSVSGAAQNGQNGKLARELLAARGAGRHPPSLGQWRTGRGTNALRRARSAIAGAPTVAGDRPRGCTPVGLGVVRSSNWRSGLDRGPREAGQARGLGRLNTKLGTSR